MIATVSRPQSVFSPVLACSLCDHVRHAVATMYPPFCVRLHPLSVRWFRQYRVFSVNGFNTLPLLYPPTPHIGTRVIGRVLCSPLSVFHQPTILSRSQRKTVHRRAPPLLPALSTSAFLSLHSAFLLAALAPVSCLPFILAPAALSPPRSATHPPPPPPAFHPRTSSSPTPRTTHRQATPACGP